MQNISINASTVSGSCHEINYIWGHSSSTGTCCEHKGSEASRLMSKSADVEFQTRNEAASPIRPSASISTSRKSTNLNLQKMQISVLHAQGSSWRGRYRPREERSSLTAEKKTQLTFKRWSAKVTGSEAAETSLTGGNFSHNISDRLSLRAHAIFSTWKHHVVFFWWKIYDIFLCREQNFFH